MWLGLEAAPRNVTRIAIACLHDGPIACRDHTRRAIVRDDKVHRTHDRIAHAIPRTLFPLSRRGELMHLAHCLESGPLLWCDQS